VKPIGSGELIFGLGLIAVVAVFAAGEAWQAKKPTGMEVKAQGKSILHILAANEDGEAVAESVTQPLFAFREESGHVDGAAILECQQATEEREKEGVKYPAVVLDCGDVKLVLVGVDLTVKK